MPRSLVDGGACRASLWSGTARCAATAVVAPSPCTAGRPLRADAARPGGTAKVRPRRVLAIGALGRSASGTAPPL
eukprot:6703326-Lingulodinium_polyedra.AAC.1